MVKGIVGMSEFIMWFDVETTGLDSHSDALLEVAAIITDMQGHIVSTPFSVVLYHRDVSRVVALCDPVVVGLHEKSGLFAEMWNAPQDNSVSGVNTMLAQWLDRYIDDDDVVYMGGNSLGLDREFAKMYLPDVCSRLSHRNVDMTSVSLFLTRNGHAPFFVKKRCHRALFDIMDSLDEFVFFHHTIDDDKGQLRQ